MRKILIVLLVVVAAGTVGYFFWMSQSGKNTITDFFPDYFPREIITDSYILNLEVLDDVTRLPNERHRASISYTSHRTVADNEKSFGDYFDKNDFIWKTVDSTDARFVLAEQNKINVSVTLWKQDPSRIVILYIANK